MGPTWCESHDPAFESKNEIVSLYRNPPADGMVVCVDEMGPLATIPRGGRGWGKKLARRPDRYHKGKTIQLLAAFAPHTGRAIGLASPNKTGEVMEHFTGAQKAEDTTEVSSRLRERILRLMSEAKG